MGAAGLPRYSDHIRSSHRWEVTMLLAGCNAIVTGGSRGIGFEISRIFLEEGAQVVAVSRDVRKLDGAKYALPSLETLVCDVSVAGEVDRMVAWVTDRWGKLDILINNAGVWTGEEPDLISGSDDDFTNTIQVNLFGAYFCTKRLLPLLMKSSDPRVINVGSRSGILSPRVRSAYGVSKASLHALTIATANELSGIVAVNALSPGWVRTDMSPDAPGDPRWSAEGALAIVTRDRNVTGKLFHGKRLRKWSAF